MMRKSVVFILSLWVLSTVFIPQAVGGDPKGNISFQPNVIPETTVTFNNSRFVFEWLENHLEIGMGIVINGSWRELEVEIEDEFEKGKFKAKMKVKGFYENETDVEIETKQGRSNITWGLFLRDVPLLLRQLDAFTFNITKGLVEEVETIEVFDNLTKPYNITRLHLPNNLVLSYEDLWLYNYTVFHPQWNETVVKGVKGESSWNLDPIVFSDNTITITGYEVEGDCDHEEIYNQLSNESQFSKQGDNQYFSNGLIVIGDGENITWFVDTNVQVEFNSSLLTIAYKRLYTVMANSNLRFGILADATAKTSYDGVSIMAYATSSLDGILIVYSGATVGLYSSLFTGLYQSMRIRNYDGTLKAYNCIFDNTYLYGNVDLQRANFHDGTEALYITTGTLNDIFISEVTYALHPYYNLPFSVSNVKVRLCPYAVYADGGITTDKYIINGDFDNWNFLWGGTCTANVVRQYTFDLTVTYPNGTGIQNANVTVKHYGQGETQDFTELTDADGKISTKTLTKGFYNQTGGNTMYSLEPFNLEISNITGYQTYNGNFTLPEKEGWIIALQPAGKSAGWMLAGLAILALISISVVVIVVVRRP